MTPRAAAVLGAADFVAAEDTRVTMRLLNHLGLKKPMVSYHEHALGRGEGILRRIEAGENCALCSDAGMPAVSDPGELLVTDALARGIRVVQVEMAQWQGKSVSSTRIRAALEAGDIAAANTMLGRPYRIDFPVRRGRGLGHTLGFPTINQVFPEGFIQPRFGIYITRVQINGAWYAGATGLGTRPTVNNSGQNPTCETFIPGFTGDLYGAQPVLEFYEYLAPSRKFDTLEELTACVQDAAAKAAAYFAPGGAGYTGKTEE